MKKGKKVISILLCTLLLLGFSYLLKGYLCGDFSEVKYGDMIGDGKYLYFTNYDIENGEVTSATLLKVSKDGKKTIPLKNDMARRLSIYKGKLYLLNSNGLWRMNLDGSDYELVDVPCLGDYYINNGRIYYLKPIEVSNTVRTPASDLKKLVIYSCNIDLKDKKVIKKGVDYFKIYKDKIFTGSRQSDGTVSVNELDLKGKPLRKLCSLKNNNNGFEIEDGYLFYCSYNPATNPSSEPIYSTIETYDNINSIDIKTGEKKVIVKDKAPNYAIRYGRIYYSVSNNDQSKIECDCINYSCNLKGLDKRRDDSFDTVAFSLKDGKTIYYIDGLIGKLLAFPNLNDGSNITNTDVGNNLRKGKVKDSKFSKGEILVPYKKMQSLKSKN